MTALVVVLGVGLVVWSVRPVLSRGRHRRAWWRRQGRPQMMRATLEAVQGEAVVPLYARVVASWTLDDWTADLPTVEIPVPLRHTSPSEVLRGSYEVDSPLFWSMAKSLGFDPVRGFDALFSVEVQA